MDKVLVFWTENNDLKRTQNSVVRRLIDIGEEISVAHLGCSSRIQIFPTRITDPNFSILDTGSGLKKAPGPWSGFFFPGSGSRGQKSPESRIRNTGRNPRMRRKAELYDGLLTLMKKCSKETVWSV